MISPNSIKPGSLYRVLSERLTFLPFGVSAEVFNWNFVDLHRDDCFFVISNSFTKRGKHRLTIVFKQRVLERFIEEGLFLKSIENVSG